MTRVGRTYTIPAGQAMNIDVSGAVGEVVEGAGATATVTRVASLESTESLGAISITSPQTLPPWPFIRVAAAGGSVHVGLNFRGA
jgi:hypothetical protein